MLIDFDLYKIFCQVFLWYLRVNLRPSLSTNCIKKNYFILKQFISSMYQIIGNQRRKSQSMLKQDLRRRFRNDQTS